MRILITGAGGFIGRRAVQYMAQNTGLKVKAMPGRTGPETFNEKKGIESVPCREIHADTVWDDALAGADVVLHLAARAHVREEPMADALTAYRKVNAEGALNLGKQAAQAGVKRFVFISSI